MVCFFPAVLIRGDEALFQKIVQLCQFLFDIVWTRGRTPVFRRIPYPLGLVADVAGWGGNAQKPADETEQLLDSFPYFGQKPDHEKNKEDQQEGKKVGVI